MVLPATPRHELSPSVAIEDHATEFYLVIEAAGADVTLALEDEAAVAMAQFILKRRGFAASGGKE
jgi:hypothetical protein